MEEIEKVKRGRGRPRKNKDEIEKNKPIKSKKKNLKVVKKVKNGRPKKLKEEDYFTVEKLAKFGLTKEMIADYVGIAYCNMYLDSKFQEVYKKSYTQLGARVRTTLLAKIEKDTIANIYLDKVINKTSEKYQDDNLTIKEQQLEIDRQKLEIEKLKNNLNVQEYEDDGFILALESKSEEIDFSDVGELND
ncbi:MAG: hypothetical protein ACRCZ0_12495 [Cetobacterium sp.]